MVERAELFAIADAIAAEGQEPSHRLIRERMRGSFSDVGPLLIEWRVQRNYRPRPHRDHLPPHLHARLATVAAEIWVDGLRQGGILGENERHAIVVERDALAMSSRELLARIDALEKRLKVLEGDGEGTGPTGLDEDQLGDGVAPADTFWARVMQEIVDLLGDRMLTARDIFAELNDETKKEAAIRDGAWSPVRLASKLRDKGNIFKHDAHRKRFGNVRHARGPEEAVRAA